MPSLNILVTGGAGFIASHIVDAYIEAGHRVTVIDDLSTGKERNLNPRAVFHRMDIRDAAAVAALFERSRFDVMNHHAAQMDVRKSVADPVFDASVNLVGVLTLLQECVRTGVRKVIFASTGGPIYGEQDYFPADEDHPTRPISPYGVAKLSTEQYLFFYRAVYGLAKTPKFTTGRVFYREGKLNIIFGKIQEDYKSYGLYAPVDRRLEPLAPGSRSVPSEHIWMLLDQPDQSFYSSNAGTRSDWITLDLASMEARAALGEKPPAQSPAMQGFYGTHKTVEERLMILNDLKNKKMITDEEYEKKRLDILKDL
jgi:hypothetical protein